MGFVISLDQITSADASRVGGKAYNCARLKQLSVVTSDSTNSVPTPQQRSRIGVNALWRLLTPGN